MGWLCVDGLALHRVHAQFPTAIGGQGHQHQVESAVMIPVPCFPREQLTGDRKGGVDERDLTIAPSNGQHTQGQGRNHCSLPSKPSFVDQVMNRRNE